MKPQPERRERDNEICRDLMLGLIYPAVLGNLIFFTLNVTVTGVVSFRDAWNGTETFTLDAFLLLKFFILLGTIAFHLSDYLYIKFTRTYRRLFFLLDCIFTATLFVTIYALRIQDRSDWSAAPNVTVIAIAFSIFIVLYLFWDIAERRDSQNSEEENTYYDRVIRWEYISLAAFGIVLAIAIAVTSPLFTTVVLVVALAVVTTLFAPIAWEKRLYFKSRGRGEPQ